MIKKLLRYDLKKMTKILVWFYVISLSLACVTRLINIGKDIQFIKIIGQIFAGCTYSAIANILINTVISILRVFFTNFYRDESYLTHTLPVTKNQLFLSKFISALIVVISSVVVCVVSLFITLYSKELMLGVKGFIEVSVSGLNMSSGLFLTIMIVILLSQFIMYIAMGYTAIVKANTYNRKRGIMGVIWFFIYCFGANIITTYVGVMALTIGGNASQLLAEVMNASSLITLLITCLILNPIYSVIHYFVARKIFNKGVNVD